MLEGRLIRGNAAEYRVDSVPPRSGGIATVHRAVAADGSGVAVKVAKDAGRLGRWLVREIESQQEVLRRRPDARRWGALMLDHGTLEDGRPFLVLPWFDRSLKDWIEERSPPIERVAHALEQAAGALVEFHHTGPTAGTPRIHRDIKPDNFLVRELPDGVLCVLADLGGAKAERLSEVARQTVVYTPAYAPIEQTLPLVRRPDPSIDVHALGVTAYWCLTRTEPDAKRLPAPYSAEGRRLVALAAPGLRLDAGETEELERLRGTDPERLVHFDEVPALTGPDTSRLRQAVEDELRTRCTSPAVLASRVVEVLREPLERALQAAPRMRDQDARRLAAACEQVRELLDRADLGRPSGPPPSRLTVPPLWDETLSPPTSPVPEAAGVPSATATPPARVARTARWPMVVGGLGVLVAGTGGLWWWATPEPAAEPETVPSVEPAPPDPVFKPADAVFEAVAPPVVTTPAASPVTPERARTYPTPTRTVAAPAPEVVPPEPAVLLPPPRVTLMVTYTRRYDDITIDGRKVGETHKPLKLEGAGPHHLAIGDTPPCSFDVTVTAQLDGSMAVRARDNAGLDQGRRVGADETLRLACPG